MESTETKTNQPIVRFEVGKIYKSFERVVCLGRFVDKMGIERIKFYSAKDARSELKECGAILAYSCEECVVRVFKGVERATLCEDTDELEDYDIRADKPLGEIDVKNKICF